MGTIEQTQQARIEEMPAGKTDCLPPQRAAEQASDVDRFGEDYARSMKVIFREHSQHEIYFKTLKLVGTTGNEDELDDAILALPEMSVHLRPPRFYLDALYACGSLDRSPVIDGENPCAEDRAVGDAKLSSPSGVAGSASDDFPAVPPADAMSADAAEADATETDAADGKADPEISAAQQLPQRYEWYLTAVGAQLLDDLAPELRLHDLLAEDPQALPIYTTILNLCVTPQNRQTIETALNDQKLMEDMGVFTSYFLDRLEQNGGLIWDGGWKTTPEGEVCLEQQGK